MSWNIHGTQTILTSNEALEYLKLYDFIHLVETWTTSDTTLDKNFESYEPFYAHGCRRSTRGRTPGGIAVFIHNRIKHIFKHIKTSEYGIYFKINSEYVSNSDKDIILVCVYIPCENSTFYARKEEENGILGLLNELIELVCPTSNVILMGDFNARTAELADYITDDDINYLALPTWWESDAFCVPRKSRDKSVNTFGLTLIDLCKELGVHMLNGRSVFDNDGEFTFLSTIGKSVVDYVLV